MGFFDEDLGDYFGVPNQGKKRAEKYQWDAGEDRKKAKEKQLELNRTLRSSTMPTFSPEMETRLKALQDESAPGELSQDPYFQGQRAIAVQGGQQALSGVQNHQGAYGTSGGFSNQGSIQDVYDRLSGRLAGLAQDSANLKSQKADRVAESRQHMADLRRAQESAFIRAQMAIESGDAAASQAALAQAFDAKEKIAAYQRQLGAQLINTGVAAATGGMSSAGAAKSSSSGSIPTSSGAQVDHGFGHIPSSEDFGMSQPYASQRKYRL